MSKLVRTTGVKVIGNHQLHVSFDDGAEGEVDFSRHRWTGVFAPLQDPEYFARVQLGLDTIVWPNDADIDPETLYHWATTGTGPDDLPSQAELA